MFNFIKISKLSILLTILETVTHNLVAVVIQILCFKYFLLPFNIIFTIIFAFLSHIIVDGIAIITYHTPEVQKGDKFWIIWHVIIIGLSLFSIIFFAIPYWLGMVFANLIDIWDWFILRPIQKRKIKRNIESKWMDKYYLHKIVDRFRDKFLGWLPKWNYKRAGILFEILLIVILIIPIILI